VLLPGGGAYEDVVFNLGESILDENGYIDRKKVSAIVFNDREKLRIHTETTHKHILKKIYDEIEHAKKNNYPIVCIDAPLLTESGLHNACDYTWAVYADEPARLKRIMKRDNLTESEAINRMKSQTHFNDIACYADVILDNNGSPEEFIISVRQRISACINL